MTPEQLKLLDALIEATDVLDYTYHHFAGEEGAEEVPDLTRIRDAIVGLLPFERQLIDLRDNAGAIPVVVQLARTDPPMTADEIEAIEHAD